MYGGYSESIDTDVETLKSWSSDDQYQTKPGDSCLEKDRQENLEPCRTFVSRSVVYTAKEGRKKTWFSCGERKGRQQKVDSSWIQGRAG